MADTPIRPLVDRGLPDQLAQLKGAQRVGDGQTNPGPGLGAARSMQTGAMDASTAGGLVPDSQSKYAHLPEPMRRLINSNLAGDPDPQVR